MDDFTPDDPLPALQAEVDQMAAMAPMIAGAAKAYFEAFTAEGFGESQALYLTISQIHSNPGKAP